MTDWSIRSVAEHCPYCGAPVELLVDPSAGAQHYIEDCEVCCRPMVVRVRSTDPVDLSLFQEDEA